MSLEDATDTAESVVEPTDTAADEIVSEATEADDAATDVEEDGPVDLDAPDEEAEPVEAAEESEDDAEADGEGDDTDEEKPVEMDVFDFGGNKLEVPKGSVPEELAAEIDKFTKGTWSSFTKGSQANAEQAKALTARAEAVDRMTTINGEALASYSHGLQLRQEIEQLSLSEAELQAEWQSNPDQARRRSDMIASKQAEFQNVIAVVGQHEAALDEAQQGEFVRRSEEGKATLDRRIKDFSTKHAPEVVEFVVKEFGMDQADADKWAVNPDLTQMAYESMMFRRMQAKAKAPNSKPAPAKPIKAMKAKGTSGANRNLDTMSDKEFRKAAGIG
jgi:hypothetical protein